MNIKVLKSVVFVLIFVILLTNIQELFQAKWHDDSNTYARIKQFYEEEQKPEVVFIGSSNVYYGINPLIIFQNNGIVSYDFSPPGQSVILAKHFVGEAIREYKPKLIVIDALGIFSLTSTTEASTRNWLDPTPITIQKVDTANNILKYNEMFSYGIKYDSLVSYLFPILRYHSRWKELTDDDFRLEIDQQYYHAASSYHGYGPHYRTVPVDVENISKFYYVSEYTDESLQIAEEYFKDIVDKCKENNIQLLLMKVPNAVWRPEYSDIISAWAEKYNIPYLDCNKLYDEIGISVETDFYDGGGHLNDSGASKLSAYLGQYISQNYDIVDHRGDKAFSAWYDDWTNYMQDKASYYISNESNWMLYLERLKNENYTIFIAAQDSIGADVHPELTKYLPDLGLDAGLKDATRTGYISIIDKGKVIYEHMEDLPLTLSTVVEGNSVEMASNSWNYGAYASIRINKQELCLNKRGLNIVVYDNILDDVVDAVTFDLYDGGIAYR